MFTAFILLYNKSILDSNTYNSIKNKGIEILVVDNSPTENNNAELCKELGIKYYSQGKNLGLSKAYNYGLSHVSTPYVLLLDDDTIISREYIEALKNIKDEEVDIYVPNVISSHNNKLYSPRVTKRYFRAINSGVVVNRRIYSNYKYDEKLFLYFVDMKFFDDAQNRKIERLNVEIVQEFSEFKKKYTDSDIRQIELRIVDAKVYYPWHLYYAYVIVFLFIKFFKVRNFKLFKVMFKGLFNKKALFTGK